MSRHIRSCAGWPGGGGGGQMARGIVSGSGGLDGGVLDGGVLDGGVLDGGGVVTGFAGCAG
jgi:hypothetical protein